MTIITDIIDTTLLHNTYTYMVFQTTEYCRKCQTHTPVTITYSHLILVFFLYTRFTNILPSLSVPVPKHYSKIKTPFTTALNVLF